MLAAGNSTRYNPAVNKTLEPIGGRPVLWYSIHTLGGCPEIDRLVIAGREQELPLIRAILADSGFDRPAAVVAGGETRRASVEKALAALDTGLVLIHDGARPFLQPRFIRDCLVALRENAGATVGVPAKDTVKLTNDSGLVLQTTERTHTFLTQTPQAFRMEELLRAHHAAGQEAATDDCMLLESLGLPVKMLMGDYRNIKITTPEDRRLMALFLGEKQN